MAAPEIIAQVPLSAHSFSSDRSGNLHVSLSRNTEGISLSLMSKSTSEAQIDAKDGSQSVR
jgi:hypothetical protein